MEMLYTIFMALGGIMAIVALIAIPILDVLIVIMCIKLVWDRFH